MGEIASSSIVVVVLFAALLVAPIVAEKTINVDLTVFEALLTMNGPGRVNKGYTDYCCKACICAISEPPKCRCLDKFEGGCPSECEGHCKCSNNIPPLCRCHKIEEECPVKQCHTSQLPQPNKWMLF